VRRATRSISFAYLRLWPPRSQVLSGIDSSHSIKQDSMQNNRKFTTVALLVEGGLALAALALGWLLKQPPLESVSISSDQIPQLGWAMLMGLIATLPLLAGLLIADRISSGPFGNLNRVVDEMIVPMFRNATVLDFAAVSLAAGLGEEMLFRGLLQSWLASHTGEDYGPFIGLAVASIVFGLCHWVTPLYALLAALVGAYLGWLFILTGNLAAPIVCHAAYDFVALLYFCRWRQQGRYEERPNGIG
jgi:membrane protease YdiL (CAAX protease family)